ncbi:MAG TPA: bifunctional diaminohydroxyphosphoribosylaminopyrimidine deaminase/5-amino-6-(5-phosphoribosylamino)uracil reductase RibD [Puia sp.]|nr:bifunctional diaminohydroxyphosphoribosylaminopyrimidine deaminase/5-amino-6-(5-phosphoribosylamino)uracil reductase RibD [Puia sp.]
MRRCLDLARLGAGHVAPNPMVGSVLVYSNPDTGEERIIGEGYHALYGEQHAEANCIASVKQADLPLIARSTIYVSLEPCAHYGKQPPCAELIIAWRIPRVVVGCRDPFPLVNGKGIEKLLAAGVEVVVGVSEADCVELNRRFFTFHTRHRPYILLKWAQTLDGRIAGPAAGGRAFISNEYSNRLVHKWRSEEAAILVGTRTALADDPALTARYWNGPDPIRLVIDKELRLPASLRLFDGKVRTIVFNLLKHADSNYGKFATIQFTGEGVAESGGELRKVEYYQLSPDTSLIHQIVVALRQLNIQSVLVEGGARLLQSFVDEGYWDEARVITNGEMLLPAGLPAPHLPDLRPVYTESLRNDTVRYYRNC